MAVMLSEHAFEPYEQVLRHQAQHMRPGDCGASVTFVGTVRDMHDNTPVESMTIECYQAMAHQEIESLCAQAAQRWDIGDSLVVHRYGEVEPGDVLVVVAVWAPHREPAFDACRHIIHHLKRKAPFWKLERTSGQRRWLTANTDDIGVHE